MLHVGKPKPTPLQAPPLVLVDWPEPGLLVSVGPAGVVFQSTDGGQTWVSKAHLEAAPGALDVAEGRWHVATDGGIYRSDNDGSTWRGLVATDDPRGSTAVGDSDGRVRVVLDGASDLTGLSPGTTKAQVSDLGLVVELRVPGFTT